MKKEDLSLTQIKIIAGTGIGLVVVGVITSAVLFGAGGGFQSTQKKENPDLENEIKKNLDIEEYIISKNVLKNELKSSKMYIEVFFKVYENIGTTSIKEEKEKTDEECNS